MTYVFTVKLDDLPKIIEYYQEIERQPTTPYMKHMFSSKEITVVIYDSLKVTLQGDQAYEDYLMWASILDFEIKIDKPEKSEKPVYEFLYLQESTIGSDEVGTGDFFGPVIVCSAFIPKEDVKKWMNFGIKDSKKLTDEWILTNGEYLSKEIKHHVLTVDNSKYNDLTDQGFNLNKIKAYLHNHAILKLKASLHQSVDRVIIDEFCSPKNYYQYLEGKDYYSDITFHQKGESISIAVACASVIARYEFLKYMDNLSKKVGVNLPLGASVVTELIAKRIVLEKGMPYLREIAKLHFKNYERIQKMVK